MALTNLIVPTFSQMLKAHSGWLDKAQTDEGRNAGEKPGTIAEGQKCIEETLALLGGLADDALDVEPDSPLPHELPTGMIFDLTAEQYARDWTLAQFYFHLMIAYAILRNNGFELGKIDYIPHLLAFVRPGTMPGR